MAEPHPRECRAKSAECRTLALSVVSAEDKGLLLQLASAWEELALAGDTRQRALGLLGSAYMRDAV